MCCFFWALSWNVPGGKIDFCSKLASERSGRLMRRIKQRDSNFLPRFQLNKSVCGATRSGRRPRRRSSVSASNTQTAGRFHRDHFVHVAASSHKRVSGGFRVFSFKCQEAQALAAVPPSDSSSASALLTFTVAATGCVEDPARQRCRAGRGGGRRGPPAGRAGEPPPPARVMAFPRRPQRSR